ncbi:amidase family protein [Opitutales bacterium ASA1]|uniref:amidase family protein n=1 Tax=Congregicoccus parvus TaxID=3081749 RepID=UPI002B2CB309|nr:amidase family protein [Opitutales bacterium ASA1]
MTTLRRLALVASLAGAVLAAPVSAFDLSTATIADIQAAMDSGALTSEKLVQLYLARIEAYDQKGPKLNTVITLNKNALAEARALDAERKAKGPRSPLHGIVVLPKDVFDTKDMPTTGGFKPMATSQPHFDSFVIDRLRKAGAIILAKLNQSDWYGVAPRGASTLAGQVLSPYNPAKWPGSSSSGTGAAMAAWFGTVGLGSDTGGSITIPTAQNNLFGFSTSHGLVSRTGMMWSSPRQENGGPMGRSVYDLAAVLDVIAGYDPADLATEASVGRMPDRPYTSFVDPDGLKGARVGVLREMVRTGPGHAEGVVLFEQAVADFRKAGAVVVDPVLTGLDLVSVQESAGAANFERHVAINKYLAALPADAPVRTVEEMLAKGGDTVKPTIIEGAKNPIPLERNPALIAAYKQQDMLRAALVDLMVKHRLDALVLPFRTFVSDPVGQAGASRADGGNNMSSYTGLPTIVAPGGFFPSDGMPFGVQFLGTPFSEPTLIKLASGWEAATKHRKAPASTPPLRGEVF